MLNLKGELVFLRALEPDDLDFLYSVENDVNNWNVTNTVAPYSKFALKNYLKRSLSEDVYSLKELRLIICTHHGKRIGCVDLFDFDVKNQRAGIGIIIANPEDRGKGFAKQALELVTEYAFSVLHLHQLYCNILSNNHSSISLFLNAQFNLVGVKKQWHFVNGEFLDEGLYQRINLKSR